MAEGWLRHLGDGRFAPFSAGTHPVGLNPDAVWAMKEVGIDISGHQSKHVNEFAGQPFDYVIIVCDRAKETCPIWPTAGTALHWSFEDPAAIAGSVDARRSMFRKIRDEIESRIMTFVA